MSMGARWTRPHWSVSPHNFAPEIATPSHPVRLVDSLSIARPAAIAYLVRELTEWVHIPVEVHRQNDFGLATASVLSAYEAGASVIHTAVNRLGYRAGNSSLDVASAEGAGFAK